MSTTATPATESQSGSGPRLFDRTRIYEFRIPHPDFPDGKLARVRFPTDAEWCKRARQLVTVQRSIGRDSTKSDIPRLQEVNLDLYASIVQADESGNPSDVLDEAEISKVIEQLERCRVISVEKSGGAYEIKLKVARGREVLHVLKIPSQKQIMDFGKSAVDIRSRRLVSETKVALEPSGELWRKLLVKCEGYAGLDLEHLSSSTSDYPVPIIHMDGALTELLMQVSAELEGEDDFDPEE